MKKTKMPKNSSFIIITSLLVSFSLIFTVIAAKTQTLIGTKAKMPSVEKWWVYIGMLGTPKETINTAKKFLEMAKSLGVNVNCISRWKNGGWDPHCYGYPFNNYEMVPGEGYFIDIIADGLSKPDWNKIKSSLFEPLSTINFTLEHGYSSISFPLDVLVKMKGMNSEQLCDEIENKSGGIVDVSEILYVKPNPYPVYDANFSWTIYTCGDTTNRFQIRPGEGYYVKSSRPVGYEPVTVTFP